MTSTVPERHGNAHGSIVPYPDFPTSDGRIVIAVANICSLSLRASDWRAALSSDPLFHTFSSAYRTG